MFVHVLVVAAGGSIGAVLRYGLAGMMGRFSDTSFPIGTLTVNVLGCALIGFFAVLVAGPWVQREELRLFILVGILGSMTTFSTFGLETLELARDGEIARAGLYVFISNAAGLGAVWAAYRLTETLNET